MYYRVSLSFVSDPSKSNARNIQTSLLSPWSLLFLLLFFLSALSSAVFFPVSRNEHRKRLLHLPLSFVNVLFFFCYLYFPEGPIDDLWFIIGASGLVSALYVMWKNRTKS